ncbi:MAG: STAS domain-containing protein [Candidatus Latescibacterota bacterium]|jgi:anti-anti-sigma factor
MKLKNRVIDGVVVVQVEGKLVGGADSDTLHDYMKELLAAGHRKFVMNLKKVPWADSRGIGMLIGAHTSVKNEDGRLVLSNISDRIDSILTLTRLLLIFKTFDSEKEAIAHLTGD